MGKGRKKKSRPQVPEATEAMNAFKFEMANELGINPEYQSGYWGNISSRESGSTGAEVRQKIGETERILNHRQGGFK